MNGLREIRTANERAMDLPQTKRENDYRVQRDKLGLALRKAIAYPGTTTETEARRLLAEIFGDTYARKDI